MKYYLMILFCFFPLDVLSIHKGKLSSRIVGGDVAETGRFPFVAAINVETSSGRFFCGGTLISTEWVITAGQCVANATSFTVNLGSNSLNDEDPNRITVTTSDYILHPGYNPETLDNDIGLIKFETPIEYTDYLNRVDFLGFFIIRPNITLIGVGWGQTSDEDTDLSNYLQWVQMTAMSTVDCQSFYGNQVNDYTLCAQGKSNGSSCYGDTGSPLIYDIGGGGRFLMHVGIASFVSGLMRILLDINQRAELATL